MSSIPPNDLGAALGIFGDKEHPGYKLTQKTGCFPVFLMEPWIYPETGEPYGYPRERLRELCEEQLKRGKWMRDETFLCRLYGVRKASELRTVYD